MLLVIIFEMHSPFLLYYIVTHIDANYLRGTHPLGSYMEGLTSSAPPPPYLNLLSDVLMFGSVSAPPPYLNLLSNVLMFGSVSGREKLSHIIRESVHTV